MIEKQYGRYVGACDACGVELGAEYDDFQDAVDGMKANGWKTVKVGEDWANYCPECAESMTPNRPGAGEFAGFGLGVGSDACTCGACGGRRIPDNDTETRKKIERYRKLHERG